MSRRQDESLHNACGEGDLHKVQEILQKDPDITYRLNQPGGFFDNTPLHDAVREGHVDILQLLLNHGASVNAANREGYTPLHYAIHAGNVDILQLFLNHGASVNAVNREGYTPLHYAIHAGNVDILQLLLNHGASVNAVNREGYTPLHYAAFHGHVDILQLLLNHGASVNAVNNDGDTPLHNAAYWGHVDILQLLLNHGASVNAVNNEGYTPLHDAAYWGHVDILQLLLNHGASVNAVNNMGETPLHTAASRARVKCIKVLLKNGANINALNRVGRTVYETAMEHEHKELAEFLRNADKDEAIRRLEVLEKVFQEVMRRQVKEYEEQGRREEARLKEVEEYTRAYSEALQEGKAKNNRIPIMVIGQDRGGKTSLMRRLLGLPFEKDQPSTTGIDVNVIELTEQKAEDPWKKREVKEFMANEGEAKTVIYKKTVEYFDRGVQRNLEGDAPEPLRPVMPVKSLPFKPLPVKPLPVKPLSPLLTEEISKIKSQSSTVHDQKEVLRVFVSDFAGQSIYYDTHGCFVKPHCPYVLVHDLSLEFDKPAVPRFKDRAEKKEIEMNNPHLNTNLDNFTSWLKLLQGLGEYQDQQFPDETGHCTTADGRNFKRPPVLIALTHSDKVKGNEAKILSVKKRIENVVSASDYENVIPGVLLIDNTLEGDDGDDVRKLRRELFDYSNAVLNQEILMPVKWLNFEVALSQKLSPDCKYIPVDEAKQEAEACGVGEFDQAIKFLHRQGVVVHHSGSSKVVLDPHWLMNRFTDVISMPGQFDALSRHALDVFERKCILFREYLQTLKDAELLEELMQKFNLICSCQHEGKAAFYVPSVASAMKPGKELEASNVPSLFVTFPRKLVPMGLFTKLQVKLISECEKRFPHQQATPSFYCNYSSLLFIIEDDVYDVHLIDLHEFIKVAVFPKQDGNHFKFASHFKATLKKCLDDLKSPDQLLFSMTSYDFEVKCTCCFGKEERECSRHNAIECDSDRCGHRHFWKLSDLQRFYNDQSFVVCRSNNSTTKFEIKSVKIWLNTDTIASQKPTRKRKKPMSSKESPMDTIGSQKPTQESKKSSKESTMCSSCASKDKTPLSSDQGKWPIGKIEFGCFDEICKLLDLTDRSKKPLMSALGGFDQTTAACIEKKYERMGGMGIAEVVLGRWGSSNHENNVGALKKILKDSMQRDDVVVEIEKWENLRVCRGCGIKLNALNKPH